MEKTYQPQAIEQQTYQRWQDAGYFRASGQGKPFSIVIPPPNVTGTLHMGHGFQQTIMDALTRYHRMLGDNTLWQPGMDHAGIATQMVVERQLAADNKTRHDLGRNDFINKVWEWKEQSGGTILNQSRRLGISPDWDRACFTMDESLCTAVKKAFIQLYREGLIYRGKRLVNWDPKLHTAISDLEVVNEESEGKLWHIRYPLKNGDGAIEIATTRPETLLGDTAIAVHPDDERYQKLIGQMVTLPLTDREIPIIADDYVDPEFGSGCVKITPAHDFNDYAMGKRHDLPMINILTIDAAINENAPEKYRGMDRFVARKAILADLEDAGLLVKTEKHQLKIPHGDKSGVVIEPFLTDQWFVKVETLTKPAIEAVESGEVRFIPENWSKTYFQWMNNLEDWCISRQLWWGHRIPAWFDQQGNVYVGDNVDDVRKHYQLGADIELTQDDDVLDTWFSAALWPFSSLGWPEITEELKTFFPTSTLVTGFDIIFFWVARMMMFSLKFTGKIPFKDIYIHGLIRDEDGQKMSKSKGNVIDPLDLIDGIELDELIKKRTFGMMQPQLAEKVTKATRKNFADGINAHGTDALRFTFCALANNSRDIRFDMSRLEGYRNFCNKLWNAARYVLMNVEDNAIANDYGNHPLNQWIVSRLQHTITKAHKYFAEYRFDYLAQCLYEFTWHEFCDWYLELSKTILNDDNASDAEKAATRYTLLSVLETILRLLHPIIPFITENIWQAVAPLLKIEADTIMLAQYPQADEAQINLDVEADIEWLQQVILGVRNIRGEMNISPAKALPLYFYKGDQQDQTRLTKYQTCLQSIARLSESKLLSAKDTLDATATALVGELELHVPLAGLIDVAAEKERLQKEIDKLTKDISRFEAKLANKNFTDKAPAAVVAKEQEKLTQAKSALEKLTEQQQKLA